MSSNIYIACSIWQQTCLICVFNICSFVQSIFLSYDKNSKVLRNMGGIYQCSLSFLLQLLLISLKYIYEVNLSTST